MVVVVIDNEPEKLRGELGIELDIEMDVDAPHETKAVVNMDSLTGTFLRPGLHVAAGRSGSFSFALDENAFPFHSAQRFQLGKLPT